MSPLCIIYLIMNSADLFSHSFIKSLAQTYGTPFYIYDERGIRSNAKRFLETFSALSPKYKNFFAVKALPNPHILKILVEEGMGLDCSSLAELLLAEMIGVSGPDIMFTSNNTPIDELKKAKELEAKINLDDISHVEYLERHETIPDHICFRYNPGPLRSGNKTIGIPEEAKYGLTLPQIIEAYAHIANWNCKTIGLHTMVASNELDASFFVETARMMFTLALTIYEKTGVRVNYVNLGGGIGIPYQPDQKPIDIVFVARESRKHYDDLIKGTELDPLEIVTENGRAITGPHGLLYSTVIHKKSTYREYVGLDACMANLMRPGMYGAYHHISVLGKHKAPPSMVYDVTGGLCENNDKFAIQRELPPIEVDDLVAIHDAGAHGHSMGFNYNGKLRSKELLLGKDGTVSCIRRAETYADLFGTIVPVS